MAKLTRNLFQSTLLLLFSFKINTIHFGVHPSFSQNDELIYGAGGPQHRLPEAVETIPAILQPPPPNPEDVVTPPSTGHSACDPDSGESPITLGRESKWNTKDGHGATEGKKGQRIHTNKYYAGIRDKFFMKNDGYNLIFQLNDPNETSELTIKADHWNDEYVFAKAVMHWGSDNRKGSEHTIHTQRFPLEIQFIHYKLSLGSLKNATKKSEGIMIASVLYELSGFNKHYFDAIINQVPAFSNPGPLKKVHGPLYIKGLFPRTLEHFEYKGSMTTLPCSSNVKRIVFATPSSVGRDQLAQLRTHLYFSDKNPMLNNFHKLMDKGSKVVFNPIVQHFDVLWDGDFLTKKTRDHW